MDPRVRRGKQWLKWGAAAVAILLSSKWLVMALGGSPSKDIFLALVTQGLGASMFILLPAFVIGWLTAPKEPPEPGQEVDTDDVFAQVAKELAAGVRDEGLWVKAFALENGDDAKAKAHYIRLRVEKLQQQPIQDKREPEVGQIESKSRSSFGSTTDVIVVAGLIGLAIFFGSSLTNRESTAHAPSPSSQKPAFSPPVSGESEAPRPVLAAQNEPQRPIESANPQSWIKIGGSTEATHYIPSQFFHEPGSASTITVLSSANADYAYNYGGSSGDLLHRSSISVFEFDCKTHSVRTLKQTLYTEKMISGTAIPVLAKTPGWVAVGGVSENGI